MARDEAHGSSCFRSVIRGGVLRGPRLALWRKPLCRPPPSPAKREGHCKGLPEAKRRLTSNLARLLRSSATKPPVPQGQDLQAETAWAPLVCLFESQEATSGPMPVVSLEVSLGMFRIYRNQKLVCSFGMLEGSVFLAFIEHQQAWSVLGMFRNLAPTENQQLVCSHLGMLVFFCPAAAMHCDDSSRACRM